MPTQIIHSSFAGGELTGALYARVDFEKYHVAAALLRNFYVDYRGGATTRPGTAFSNRARSTVPGRKRMIRFVVSEVSAYALEFGDQYIRYFFDGAPVLEAATNISGITQANPAMVTDNAHGYSDGDEIEITDVGGMVQLNGRNFLVTGTTANTYQLEDLDGNPINSSAYGVYTAGGHARRVLTTVSPWLATDLVDLKVDQSADVMTVTHPAYAPRRITRTGPGTFTLTVMPIGTSQAAPAQPTVTRTGAGTGLLYVYVVTSVSLDGKEESLASIPGFILSDFLEASSTAYKTNKLVWVPSISPTSVYRVYKAGGVQGGNPAPTVFGFIGEARSANFEDIAFAPDYSKNPPLTVDPFSGGQVASISVTAGGTGYGTDPYIPLTFVGDGTGAAGFAVVDPTSHAIVGAFLTSSGKNYTAATATAAGGTGAIFALTFSSITPRYPACSTYFQQRHCFGGLDGAPETIAVTQTGNYTNFNQGIVVQASDGFEFGIASREVNSIKALVPMNEGMITFTSGGAFLVSGGQQTGISPTNLDAPPQASSGINHMPPIVVNNDVLFCQGKGNSVRDLQFNFGVQSYYGFDRSSLASHLFTKYTLLEWAWAEEPFKLVWAIRSDGRALSLAYVPEQEVYGWSRHDTYGSFESVCAIPEGDRDAVYFIVNRPINGVWKQFVERLAPGQTETVEDSWQVDCGLSYPLESPGSILTLSGNSGSVIVRADAATFSAGNVGDVIWFGGGKLQITAYSGVAQVVADVLLPVTNVLDDGTPLPSSDWSIGTPVTNVSGLDHLAGMTNVSVVADGLALINQTVAANGSLLVDLPWPSTKIVVGLPYRAQLQTLNLEVQSAPTLQGKKKAVNRVTSRLQNTRGLQIGDGFDRLIPMKDTFPALTAPAPLFSGDITTMLYQGWNDEGRMCYQQDLPYPATILGFIPEFVVGDTQTR